MAEFRFSIPLETRYGDLDPQWHLNNARFLTFFEHARMAYLVHLGLWDGKDFFKLGLIVADVHVSYLAPVEIFRKCRVELRVSRLGNKSMTFEYRLVDEEDGTLYATAETVMVSYDYYARKSIPIPSEWREKITAFEGLTV